MLITKFREFTDVVMTLPVIYSACRSNPSLHFRLLTLPRLVPLFVNRPENLDVEGLEPPAGAWTAAFKLWKELAAKYKPEYYVALDRDKLSRRLALAARVGGCRVSVIKRAADSRRLTRPNNKIMLPLTTARARYREAFFRLGIPVQEHFDGLYGAGRKGDPALFATITPGPHAGERWVGVAPFAKHRGKAYPPELMEEVITLLEQEVPNLKIILFGGGEREKEILAGWTERHRGTISPAVVRLPLEAELALMSHLDVMLTMDSANMHLASIAGVPVLTLWGATHPYCGYKGWRQGESAAISLPMPCRPCSLYGDKECLRGDYHCLSAIRPRLVADRLKALLDS